MHQTCSFTSFTDFQIGEMEHAWQPANPCLALSPFLPNKVLGIAFRPLVRRYRYISTESDEALRFPMSEVASMLGHQFVAGQRGLRLRLLGTQPMKSF